MKTSKLWWWLYDRAVNLMMWARDNAVMAQLVERNRDAK